MKILTLTILCALHGFAYAEDITSFKAICIREKASGFSWKDGEWTQANFKPGNQILVQKLDFQTFASKPIQERPILCQSEPTQEYGNTKISKGCYLIKEVGAPAYIFSAEMCAEIMEGNAIKSIQCRRLSFHPDGPFIEFPWHADIDPKPKDNYKDSLVLHVGKCSRLAE